MNICITKYNLVVVLHGCDTWSCLSSGLRFICVILLRAIVFFFLGQISLAHGGFVLFPLPRLFLDADQYATDARGSKIRAQIRFMDPKTFVHLQQPCIARSSQSLCSRVRLNGSRCNYII